MNKLDFLPLPLFLLFPFTTFSLGEWIFWIKSWVTVHTRFAYPPFVCILEFLAWPWHAFRDILRSIRCLLLSKNLFRCLLLISSLFDLSISKFPLLDHYTFPSMPLIFPPAFLLQEEKDTFQTLLFLICLITPLFLLPCPSTAAFHTCPLL